jgi:hypothetical protein
MTRREPIEEMIEDFYYACWDDDNQLWDDVHNFTAYLSQVDEEMYPIAKEAI